MKKLRYKCDGTLGVLEYSDKEDKYSVKFLEAKPGDVGGLYYDTLAKVMKDWEDYEEQKEYWYIRDDGSGIGFSPFNGSTVARRRAAIGNYFETEEEAERAVEKLKAWKRLRDKGFKFNGGDDSWIAYSFNIVNWDDETEKDFNLLFGGEE